MSNVDLEVNWLDLKEKKNKLKRLRNEKKSELKACKALLNNIKISIAGKNFQLKNIEKEICEARNRADKDLVCYEEIEREKLKKNHEIDSMERKIEEKSREECRALKCRLPAAGDESRYSKIKSVEKLKEEICQERQEEIELHKKIFELKEEKIGEKQQIWKIKSRMMDIEKARKIEKNKILKRDSERKKEEIKRLKAEIRKEKKIAREIIEQGLQRIMPTNMYQQPSYGSIPMTPLQQYTELPIPNACVPRPHFFDIHAPQQIIKKREDNFEHTSSKLSISSTWTHLQFEEQTK